MAMENAVQGCKLQKSLSFSQDEELYIATSDTKSKMEKDYKPFVDKVLNSISFIPESILDLGCGPGYIARRFNEVLPNARVIGVDISSVMVDHAVKAVKTKVNNQDLHFESYSNFTENNIYNLKNFMDIADNTYFSSKLKYMVANSESLPFGENYFDLIILKGTFKCLENKARSLKEMYRVLNTNSEILIYEFRKEIPEDEFNMLTKDMQPQKIRSLRNKLNCSPDISEYKKCLLEANLINFSDIKTDGLDLMIRIVKS
jgi:ubiquinone/menaquinone biosynthesis C-methylase UbiE